ncbi:ABC transporter permease subunit [Mesorhizobium sp. VK24D]|uniref:ABC transporter permease subunit n=1 Tax=Mesorhizobium album TaxID=3072314 RepID=A0ABU4XYU6_9HYPH|nr:ABC transporter permease subunit [Mesorhizobium sp. VK24D]MDX8479862.1 ABC transporter permease subunit [Mesorhizobium sp. VK24D]
MAAVQELREEMSGPVTREGTGSRHDPRLLVPFAQLAPILVLIGAFLLLPLLGALWGSINGAALDFSRYRAILTDPLYADVLLRSLRIGVVTTTVCVLLGYPVAYFMTTLERRKAALFSIALLVPLFTAFLIRTYGWMVILGRRGVLNTLLMDFGLIDRPLQILGTSAAVYIGLVHVLMPTAVFILYASMSQLDRSLQKASQVLGAHPVRAFMRVYLPMSLPAIISAAVLIFIISIGFYITPVLLGGPSDTMISQLVVTQLTTLLDFQTGYAVAICLLTVTIAMLALSNLFVPIEQMWALQESHRRPGFSDKLLIRARSGKVTRPFRWLLLRLEDALYAAFGRSSCFARILLWAYLLLVIAFLLAPLLIAYLLSFSSSPFLVYPPPGFSLRWYRNFMMDPEWRIALFQSLKLATVVACLSVIIGGTAAFALVRGRMGAKREIFLFILAPLLLPVIILALGLYVSLGKLGLIGSFAGLVIGHLLYCAPYAVIILVAAVRGLDRNIESAAATLGAGPARVFWKIVVPILSPALLAAWLMSFLQSFDELLITLFLLGRQAPTLPIKMWSDIRIQLDPTMSAASSIIVTVVILVVGGSQIRAFLAGTRKVQSEREGQEA